jgi:DNA recombination protein Rad52
MKTFSADQVDALKAPLSREVVKMRATFSYIESWHAIAECNRIFGFDGWTSETLDLHCVVEKERLVGKQAEPGWGVTYTARCRINVLDGLITRDGVGAGHGIDRDLGQAHESAIKEAESDAQKRALRQFGNQFGLALYDKTQANVVDESDLSRARFIEECKTKIASFPEGTRDVLVWWATDEQYKARRDFDLRPGEVIELKSLVTAKAKLAPPGPN